MSGGTQIRFGALRYGLRAGGTIHDPCEVLATIARANLRAFIDDPRLRTEILRRVMSPPCAVRCYVSPDGAQNDCTCSSGFQYTSDPEQQASIGCEARDVWNDARALLVTHEEAGRGPDDPIMVDCDCITPTSLAAAAWLAWYGPPSHPSIAGAPVNLGGVELPPPPSAVMSVLLARAGMIEIGSVEPRRSEARFAVGITLPPDVPGKARVGHCYGLVNRRPKAPQPPILMPFEGGPWYVWDLSAHFGMPRPADAFYTTGEAVAYPLVSDDLYGLKIQGRR